MRGQVFIYSYVEYDFLWVDTFSIELNMFVHNKFLSCKSLWSIDMSK